MSIRKAAYGKQWRVRIRDYVVTFAHARLDDGRVVEVELYRRPA